MRLKIKILIVGLFISLGLISQNYDMYRVIAYSNDSIEVVSMSNTVLVPRAQMIFVPNAFSPDGDHTNDKFQVMGRGLDHITIEIYNRWGQMVFEAPHLNESWDGTYRGKPCPIGTYVYQLLLDKKRVYSGTITLVR